MFFRYFSSSGPNFDTDLKRQLSSIKPLENPSRGVCVMCKENQFSSNNVESDPSNSELAAQLSVITEAQKKAVISICTESYTTVLQSGKLENLCDSK